MVLAKIKVSRLAHVINKVFMFRIFSLLIVLLLVGCVRNSSDSVSENVSDAPEGMAYIPGGELDMGGDNEQASTNEYPKHKVEISPLYMDTHEITNDEYAIFVDATRYLTVAERAIDWEELKSMPFTSKKNGRTLHLLKSSAKSQQPHKKRKTLPIMGTLSEFKTANQYL